MRVENQRKTGVYAQKPRLKMSFKKSVSETVGTRIHLIPKIESALFICKKDTQVP
jgi:hypothetical protein